MLTIRYMNIDLAELMKNPQVQKMVQSLVGQLGKGGQGNLAGLTEQLKTSGLPLDSWLGSGKNEPITGAQLSAALGPQAVQRAAQDSGASPDTINKVAEVLPELVNEASPNGQLDPDALNRLVRQGQGGAGQDRQPEQSPQASQSGQAPPMSADPTQQATRAAKQATPGAIGNKPAQTDYTGTIKQ